MSTTSLSIDKVNRMSCEEFIECFGNVVERCSLCAATVWKERPFRDAHCLVNCFDDFIDWLPIRGKEGVLRLYLDIAGRLPRVYKLSPESIREQANAGIDKMSEEEHRRMKRLNERYKTKFGFPFVICARENKKDAIIKGLEERLENSPQTESITGINEVKKICRLRVLDIVNPNSQLTHSRL